MWANARCEHPEHTVTNRPPDDHDARVLPETEVARLLARASELDARRRAGHSIGELRAAATEAGISAHAFEAALEELQGERPLDTPSPAAPPAPVRGRARPGARWLIALPALLVALAIGSRAAAPPGGQAEAGEPIHDATLEVRCVTAREAAEAIRPLLTDRRSSVRFRSADGPRTLDVRATEVQLQRARAAIIELERAAPTCPADVAR